LVENNMTKLKARIVDDEPLARMRLAALLNESTEPQVEVVGEAGDSGEAMAWLNRLADIDVLLLDIQMPGLSGTQLAALLRQRSDAPAVVFVTAHTEHALHAFELDAVDYLTKPVRRERLQAALDRVAQRRPKAEDAAPVIVVSDRGRMQRIPLADVLYLKAELKYVTLRTAHHTFVLDDPLSELAARLGDRFIRVHRNALVARDAVRALERRVIEGDDGSEGWAVQVAPNGEWLAVSRRQLTAVRDALSQEGL
jgi:two-component system, LytTR family, response regulator AlgR